VLNVWIKVTKIVGITGKRGVAKTYIIPPVTLYNPKPLKIDIMKKKY
jgi:hypothetical protein